MKMRRLTLKIKFTRHGQIDLLIDLLIGPLPELDHVDQPTHFHGYNEARVLYYLYGNDPFRVMSILSSERM